GTPSSPAPGGVQNVRGRRECLGGGTPSRLAAVLKDVERGKEILVTRSGRPVARLVPVADPESHSCWSGYTPRAGPHRCRESNRFASPRSFVDEERARGAGLIRFWETSALVKLYSATEAGHRNALRRLHGRKARTARQATSTIALVELLSAGAAVP